MGVFLHVVGDALNNIGVMASAAAILWGKTERRYYADPAVSLAISFMICATSIPLGEFVSSFRILWRG
jgi:zinc transporter 1